MEQDVERVLISEEDVDKRIKELGEKISKDYEGKTVQFVALTGDSKRLPEGCFVVGRQLMTCCVEDIQFAALVCEYPKAKEIKDDSWIMLTAKIHFAFHKAYHNRGPVLSYVNHEYCDAPDPEVASFY